MLVNDNQNSIFDSYQYKFLYRERTVYAFLLEPTYEFCTFIPREAGDTSHTADGETKLGNIVTEVLGWQLDALPARYQAEHCQVKQLELNCWIGTG